MYISLEDGVPKINFTTSIPSVNGKKAVFRCEAELTGAKIGLDVLWYFYKWNGTLGQDITKNAEMKRSGKPPAKTVDSALNVTVGAKTAGVYQCLVMVSVQGYNGFNFTRNATLKGKLHGRGVFC